MLHENNNQSRTFLLAIFAAMLVALSSLLPQAAEGADRACETTLNNSGLVDVRSFPTVPGDTVINGRNDGNPATCTIASLGNSRVSYGNGLTINTEGTGLAFRLIEVTVDNGLTVNDAGNGTGLVTMQADIGTRISGAVNVINNARLKLITHTTRSSTTRLRVDDAYFNIEAGSELLVEYKLGDTTGGEFNAGGLEGGGDVRLSNVGTRSREGFIIIQNRDGRNSTFSGNIHYENQNAPAINKLGTGTFTFTGDVKKSSGDTLGFTDGFGLIELNGGAFETTTEAFVFGTRVLLEGGDLILNQATDGEITGATFDGTSDIYKRGTGTVTLGGISSLFRGDIFVEEGTLGMSGSASLSNASNVNVSAGTFLDVSRVNSSIRISRLSGAGTLALGDKDVSELIRIAPGNSIGVLNVTGSGTLNLTGSLINIEIDPTLAPGDVPGTTHDQLAVAGPVNFSVPPVIALFDVQNAGDPTAFLGGREFTVLTAGSGLNSFPAAAITEDVSSFHAFIGADPLTSVITDTEVKVKFGIKTAQQVASTVGGAVIPTPAGGSATGSTKNKQNATSQYLQKTVGLTGNQAPTQAQLLTQPALQNLTTANLTRAMSNNNPEAYSSNLTLSLEYADLVANMAMDHASGAGLAWQSLSDDTASNGRFWVNAAVVDGDVNGTKNETGDFDYVLGSITAGTDIFRSETHTVGLYAGAGITRMGEHDHIDQAFDGTMTHVGVYNQYRFGDDYRINGQASLLYGSHDTKRQNYDTLGGFASASEADFSSLGVVLGVKASKTFKTGSLTYSTPSAGLTLARIEQDEIQETGGGSQYDYHIDKAEAHAVVLGFGLDVTRTFETGRSPLVGDFRIRYEYDAYADNNAAHDIQAGLEGQQKHEFSGQNRGAHGLLVGFGLEKRVGVNMTFGAGYMFTIRSEGSDHDLGANFTYYW